MNSQESKKPKQKKSQRRLVAILKVAGYVLMWLFVWSCVAIALAIGSLIIAQGLIPKEADGIAYMTARQANNIVLVIILIIAAIFFGFVWLLRKKKSLSYRVSRMTLLVCTIIGLLVGVPLSLMGVWEPDDAQQNQAQQVDTVKDVKRYQYMLCSDGSYRSYTDEQMKDSRAGFTKGSEDYCKKDGQGKILRLTDSLDEAKANDQKPTAVQQTPSYPVGQSSRSEPSCFNYVIYYDYERIDSNEYTVGRGKTIQDGVNGEGVRCYKDGNIVSDKVVKEPVNDVYAYGTRESSHSGSGNGGNSHSCGYYQSIGMINSTYAAGCTP